MAGALGLAGLAVAGIAAVPQTPAESSQLGATVKADVPHATVPPAQAPPPAILVEPRGATIELYVALDAKDSLETLLLRSGAQASDATKAAALVAAAVPAGIPEKTEVAILLGEAVSGDKKRLERISLQPAAALKLVVGRGVDGNLRLVREGVAVDATPQRISGRVGEGLFWSLRAAGVPAEAATEFMEALSGRLDIGRDLKPEDQFQLVIEQWRAPNGRSRSGSLLYAGIRRPGGNQLHLVRWSVGGRTEWFEPGKPSQRVKGLEQPVSGAVSSRFGRRLHPILRIGRFHSGVDFGASWGSPVVAAADGAVIAAEWNGGYGRQVRLAHSSGLSTSYSHLSRISAAPGTFVRRGQVIGYVGSTGLSTGPHLHYEVHRDGRPLDPMTFSHSQVTKISAEEQAALDARLQQLRSI